MTEGELREAGAYFVQRLRYYTRKWLKTAETSTPIEQARLLRPDSQAWKATRRKFNIGWEDTQRLERAWRAALLEALDAGQQH